MNLDETSQPQDMTIENPNENLYSDTTTTFPETSNNNTTSSTFTTATRSNPGAIFQQGDGNFGQGEEHKTSQDESRRQPQPSMATRRPHMLVEEMEGTKRGQESRKKLKRSTRQDLSSQQEQQVADSGEEEEVGEEGLDDADADAESGVHHQVTSFPTSRRRGATTDHQHQHQPRQPPQSAATISSANNPFALSKEEEAKQEEIIQAKIQRKKELKVTGFKKPYYSIPLIQAEMVPLVNKNNNSFAVGGQQNPSSAALFDVELTKQAKEIAQQLIDNPWIHQYGKGIKFYKELFPCQAYNLASTQALWKIVMEKVETAPSFHNMYLNIMSYIVKYLCAMGQEFSQALGERLLKNDKYNGDLLQFAEYLNSQVSNPFHISELPGRKYDSASQFNLLRLCEIKYEFCQVMMNCLQPFFKTRKWSARMHWNSRTGGSLVSPNITPSNSQHKQLNSAGSTTFFYNEAAAVGKKSDTASRLADTNFKLNLENARNHRNLFLCEPVADVWKAQHLQVTSEKENFPKEGNPCLFFTPLRMMLENVKDPSNLEAGDQRKMPGWYYLYRDGVCNIAGENLLDGKIDTKGGYDGVWDLNMKFPKIYVTTQEKKLVPTNQQQPGGVAQPQQEIIVEKESKESFFLQSINLSWTAILSSENSTGFSPKTTFTFMDRNKKRAQDCFCQVSPKEKKQEEETTVNKKNNKEDDMEVEEEPHTHKQEGEFARIVSEANVNVERIFITQDHKTVKPVLDQAINDKGFFMLEPTLQVSCQTSKRLCQEILEWIMNVNFTGLEGRADSLLLYELTLFCLGHAKRGLLKEKRKLVREGFMTPEGNVIKRDIDNEQRRREEARVSLGGAAGSGTIPPRGGFFS